MTEAPQAEFTSIRLLNQVLHWARYILVEQERTDTRPDDAPVLGLYD